MNHLDTDVADVVTAHFNYPPDTFVVTDDEVRFTWADTGMLGNVVDSKGLELVLGDLRRYDVVGYATKVMWVGMSAGQLCVWCRRRAHPNR